MTRVKLDFGTPAPYNLRRDIRCRTIYYHTDTIQNLFRDYGE